MPTAGITTRWWWLQDTIGGCQNHQHAFSSWPKRTFSMKLTLFLKCCETNGWTFNIILHASATPLQLSIARGWSLTVSVTDLRRNAALLAWQRVKTGSRWYFNKNDCCATLWMAYAIKWRLGLIILMSWLFLVWWTSQNSVKCHNILMTQSCRVCQNVQNSLTSRWTVSLTKGEGWM